MKLLVVTLIFGLSAILCPLTRISAEPTQSVNVGWIGPLSGNSAVLGVDSLKAMQLVIDQANSLKERTWKRIELIAEDDQYTSAKTIQAYEKLVHQDHVKVIIVVTYGGLFALSERAARDKILLIDPLDCDEKIASLPDNVICIGKLTEDLANPIVNHALKHRSTPVAIIYDESDPFPVNMATLTENQLRQQGVSDVMKVGHDATVTDFKTTILQLKSKNVKAIYFYGYDNLGLAMNQARKLGFEGQFYSTATIASEGFQAAAAGTDNGTIVPLWTPPDSKHYKRFLSDFEIKEGRKPYIDISTVPSYDIANIIVSCLNENTAAPEKHGLYQTIRNCFYNLKNYSGASGNITLDPDGATRSFTIELAKFVGGKFETISKD